MWSLGKEPTPQLFTMQRTSLSALCTAHGSAATASPHSGSGSTPQKAQGRECVAKSRFSTYRSRQSSGIRRAFPLPASIPGVAQTTRCKRSSRPLWWHNVLAPVGSGYFPQRKYVSRSDRGSGVVDSPCRKPISSARRVRAARCPS